MAFLSAYYFIPACFEERKREKITYLEIVLLEMSPQSPPPEFSACSINHTGNSSGSEDFGHCDIPIGCLEGSYISTTSLQAGRAQSLHKCLITQTTHSP